MNKNITTAIFVSSFALTVSVLGLTGCEKQEDSDVASSTAKDSTAQIATDRIETPTVTDELLGSETLLDAAVNVGQTLRESVQALLANPTEENFAKAKDNWMICHNAFQSFSPYLSISQSNPGLFSSLETFEASLDARPIQPGFLDYFAEYSHSGIVNDIALPLTAANLREQHGITDSSDVALGFHAIEYLLWGEEGSRPLSDFIATTTLTKTQQDEGLRVIDLPNNRRRTLLQLQTDLLVDDLASLLGFWNDPQGAFRQTYFLLPLKSRNQLIKSAAIVRLQIEINALQEIIDLPEKAAPENPTGHSAIHSVLESSTLYSHNQFANQNLGNIVQPLLTIKLGFLEDAAPFQPKSSLTLKDNLELATKIDAITEKLNKKMDSWPIEKKLAKEIKTLLAEVVDYLTTEEALLE